jgi:hypothetical protein
MLIEAGSNWDEMLKHESEKSFRLYVSATEYLRRGVMMKAMNFVLLLLVVLFLTACLGGGGGGSSASSATGVTLSSISISPATASIAAGLTKQFTVTGNYSDGTTQSITTASWSSSSTTVATIDSFGLARGVAIGSTNIVASFGGKTATASLAVTSAVLTSSYIRGLTPSVTSYAKRTSMQLWAGVNYSDGKSYMPTSTTWSSSNNNVFTISNSAISNGVLTGVGPGTATITLTVDGVVSTQTITLVNPVATPLLVTCDPAFPMTLSASTWNTNYALDPNNATEWVTVDPVSCAAYSFVVLVVPSTSRRILEVSSSGTGFFWPAFTTSSSLTPQLSIGEVVKVGYETSFSSLLYTSIYSITAQ